MTDDQEDSRSWTVHPAAQHPAKAVLGLVLIGMVLGAIYQYTHEVIYCIIGFVVFMVTLAPFFQKTAYQLDASGVLKTQLGIKRFLSWPEIRGYTISENGIFLSTKKYGNWRDFRGIFILFGGDREATIAWIKKKMAENKAEPGDGIQG